MTAVSFATMAGLVGVKPAVQRQLRVVPNTPEPEVVEEPRGGDIRPDTFDELIGQEEAIVQILTVLEASEEDQEPAYPHMLLDGPSGVGKALRDDQPVLTPTGWTAISKLVVGDQVVGSNGQPCRVTGVYPQGIRQLFEVTTSDGVTVVADADHLWLTQTVDERADKRFGSARTTREIANTLTLHRGGRSRSNHYLPMLSAPVDGPTVDCPLDPWLVGALLGDGGLTGPCTVTFTNPDELLLARVREVLPEGTSLNARCPDGLNWSIGGRRGGKGGSNNVVLDGLRELGVHGLHSYEKRIPDVLLYASRSQRHALLTGLLDTDGSVYGYNHVEYSTSSAELATQVRWLVQSLGGTARTCERSPRYTYGGEVRTGRPAWRLSIVLPAGVRPFAYSAKASKYVPRSKYPPRRQIVSVVPVADDFATCISVDSPDKLYATAGCVLTHNTTLCLAIAKRRGTQLHIYAPSSLRRADDVRSMLLKINKGDVVLIDEVHGLRPAIEESIYPALEGLPVPVSEGSGRNRQTTTIKLPPCTFVGGTTSTGGLAEPLRNRFAVQVTLRRYTDDEISRILRRASRIRGYAMTAAGADRLALLARGTARIATNELLTLAYAVAKKTRQLAPAGPDGEPPETVIDETAVEAMMATYGYDEYGLKERDRMLLRTLCLKMGGGPIGVEKLANATDGVDIKTAKQMESYLAEIGLMTFDGSGRKATVLGYKLLSETDGRVYKPPAIVVGWSRQNGFIDEAWLDAISGR